jgi:ribosomal protein S18 acetylase RimI-like enzyme
MLEVEPEGEHMTTNEADILIRRATKTDADALAAVLHTAFGEYEALYTPEGFAATTPIGEQIQQRMDEGPVWVALRTNAVIGTISAVLKGRGVYVRGMALLPTARGLGLGQSLLAQVEVFAHEQQAERLFLSTTPFLNRAIRLYKRVGFQRSAEGPHDLFGTPLFTMEKPLLSGP